jgi:hypothetical protein
LQCYFPIWMFCTLSSVLCELCVQYPVGLFPVVPWFCAFPVDIRGMLLKFFLNYFEMVPVTPLITGSAFVFTFYIHCMSTVEVFIVQNLGFFLDYISLPEIATPINIRVTLSLSRILMSGLLLGMVVSVCLCWFHSSMITLLPWTVSTNFGTC